MFKYCVWPIKSLHLVPPIQGQLVLLVYQAKIKNCKTAQYIMIPYRLTNRGEQLHKRRITGSATAQSTPEGNHIVLLSEQDNRRTNDNKYLTWLCVIQFKRIQFENCTSIHPSIYPWREREGGGGCSLEDNSLEKHLWEGSNCKPSLVNALSRRIRCVC